MEGRGQYSYIRDGIWKEWDRYEREDRITYRDGTSRKWIVKGWYTRQRLIEDLKAGQDEAISHYCRLRRSTYSYRLQTRPTG